MSEQILTGNAGISPPPVAGEATKQNNAGMAKKADSERDAARMTPLQKESEGVEEKSISEEQKESLANAFDGLNQVMRHFNKSIHFEVFDKSGDLYAKVVNMETQEVIKTIPSREALEMMTRVSEVLGMLVDETS